MNKILTRFVFTVSLLVAMFAHISTAYAQTTRFEFRSFEINPISNYRARYTWRHTTSGSRHYYILQYQSVPGVFSNLSGGGVSSSTAGIPNTPTWQNADNLRGTQTFSLLACLESDSPVSNCKRSDAVTITLFDFPTPPAPTNFAITPTDGYAADFTWTASADATYYQLLRRSGAAGSSFVLVDNTQYTTSPSTYRGSLRGLQTFRLRACNDGADGTRGNADDKCSGASNFVQITLIIGTPPAPSIALAADTGVSNTDGTTMNGLLDVTLADYATAWELSTNGGGTWSRQQTGSRFVLPEGTHAAGRVRARQIADSVVSPAATLGAVTVDRIAPDIMPQDASLPDDMIVGVQTSITLTYSEPVYGVSIEGTHPDIFPGDSTALRIDGLSGNDSDTTRTITFTPLKAGTVSLSIRSGSYTDAAGNASGDQENIQGTAAFMDAKLFYYSLLFEREAERTRANQSVYPDADVEWIQAIQAYVDVLNENNPAELDFNEDGEVGSQDAVLLYYHFALRDSLAIPAIRRAVLGSFLENLENLSAEKQEEQTQEILDKIDKLLAQ